MDVLFHDPYVPDGRDRALGIRRVETLAELLGQSYVVSLHCPLTAETRHLINPQTLAQMAAGSYLVNTARGGVVDPLAVLDAVTGGHLPGPLSTCWKRNHRRGSSVGGWLARSEHPAHDRIILIPILPSTRKRGCWTCASRGVRIAGGCCSANRRGTLSTDGCRPV